MLLYGGAGRSLEKAFLSVTGVLVDGMPDDSRLRGELLDKAVLLAMLEAEPDDDELIVTAPFCLKDLMGESLLSAGFGILGKVGSSIPVVPRGILAPVGMQRLDTNWY